MKNQNKNKKPVAIGVDEDTTTDKVLWMKRRKKNDKYWTEKATTTPMTKTETQIIYTTIGCCYTLFGHIQKSVEWLRKPKERNIAIILTEYYLFTINQWDLRDACLSALHLFSIQNPKLSLSSKQQKNNQWKFENLRLEATKYRNRVSFSLFVFE